MTTKIEGNYLKVDLKGLIQALPFDVKRDLVASMFADEEYITRVVDVLTTGVTTDDIGSLYNGTLERLQTRIADAWPEMAKELVTSLVRRVRFLDERLAEEREHRSAWIAYHSNPLHYPRPPQTLPLPLRATSAGMAARDAEIDRIIAAAKAAEEKALKEG